MLVSRKPICDAAGLARIGCLALLGTLYPEHVKIRGIECDGLFYRPLALVEADEEGNDTRMS